MREKLQDWAKKQGVNYRTALKWFHSGEIPGAERIAGGTIFVNEENIEEPKQEFHHSLENDVRYFLEILGLKKDVVDKIVEIVRKEKPE